MKNACVASRRQEKVNGRFVEWEKEEYKRVGSIMQAAQTEDAVRNTRQLQQLGEAVMQNWAMGDLITYLSICPKSSADPSGNVFTPICFRQGLEVARSPAILNLFLSSERELVGNLTVKYRQIWPQQELTGVRKKRIKKAE